MSADLAAVEAQWQAESRYREQRDWYLNRCHDEREARRGLCRWPTCERPVQVKRRGLCWVHNAQRIKGTLGWTRQYDRRPTHCTEDGCDRPVLGRQLCSLHYQRERRAAAGKVPMLSKGRAGAAHWRARRRATED